jgi:hypothetical protein
MPCCKISMNFLSIIARADEYNLISRNKDAENTSKILDTICSFHEICVISQTNKK